MGCIIATVSIKLGGKKLRRTSQAVFILDAACAIMHIVLKQGKERGEIKQRELTGDPYYGQPSCGITSCRTQD